MHCIKTGGYEYNIFQPTCDPSRLTLLFIHGASLSKGIWKNQIKNLCDTANVLALDLPGHGGSEGPGKDSVKAYSESVRHFIHESGIHEKNLILCGMSMGGAIVQQLIIDYPEVCRAGILINTGARLKVLPMVFESITADFDGFIRSTPSFALSPSTEKTIYEKEILEFSSACTAKTALDDFTACNGFDVMDKIDAIVHPMLVFSAEHDLSTPPKYGIWLANHLKNSVHVHVNDAGHYSPIEKPDMINDEIRRFISGMKIL